MAGKKKHQLNRAERKEAKAKRAADRAKRKDNLLIPNELDGHPNPKQWLFIHEYLVDRVATRAAIAAGYSEKSAPTISRRLLDTPCIILEIENAQYARMAEADVRAERILAEYKKLAFSNILDFITVKKSGKVSVNLSLLTSDQGAAIKKIKVEDGELQIDFHDKLRALDSLARYKQMFVDRVLVEVDEKLGDRLTRARRARAEADKIPNQHTRRKTLAKTRVKRA